MSNSIFIIQNLYVVITSIISLIECILRRNRMLLDLLLNSFAVIHAATIQYAISESQLYFVMKLASFKKVHKL